MCHENPNLDNALSAMEEAAEQLSLVQKAVNAPMFDLLFKLVNLPQATKIAGAKLKVLHTYAHRFLEFYMTECPDGVSIHTINVNDVSAISSKLRALGDGLARLLAYLGLEQENEQLTEYVDKLAVAYDAFAAMMSRVDAIHDEYYADEDECECCACEEGCCGDCFSDCGCCCNESCEEEGEEEKNEPAPEAKSSDKEREMTEKLFEQPFGVNSNTVKDATQTAKNTNEPKSDSVKEDDAADYMAEMLSKMLGVPKENIHCAVKCEQKRITDPDEFVEYVKRARTRAGIPSFPFPGFYPAFWRLWL